MSSPNPAPISCGKLDASAYMAQGLTDNLLIANMTNPSAKPEDIFASILAAINANEDASGIEAQLRIDGLLLEEASSEAVVEHIKATMTVLQPVIEDDWSCCLDPYTGLWYPWSPTKGWSRAVVCSVGT